MELNIVEICMTPVNAVKVTLKNMGAVCRNCESYWHGQCMMTEYEVSDPDSTFCMEFEFRDVEACAELWKKICDECENNQNISSENA